MPPKPKSPAKGKKGKLSKAEKERLKKEEAERKLQEEEEARLKAEQEERERQERERLEREERERIEAAESQRHCAEVAELKSILEGNRNALFNRHEQRRAKAKWDRYMQCDGKPDPTIAPEINTYINLWKEDTDKSSIDVVLEESKQTLQLIGELEFLIDDLPEESYKEATVEHWRETITELQILLALKLDEATVLLLKAASTMADSETGNLQLIKSSADINMMLWGNLTKNPRFKSFEFEAQHLSFELPKQLALSDIAVRIIHTKFDHFSHLCRTFWPKNKKKPKTPPEVEDVMKEEEKPAEGEGEAAGGEEKEDAEKEDKEEEKEKEDESNEEKQDTQENGGESVEKPEETSTEKEEQKDAVTEGTEAEEMEEEEDELDDLDDEDTVDLRAYQVLGGVVHFDLLTLPPQPKQVKHWLMTQVTTEELKRVSYTSGDPSKLGMSMSGTMLGGQTLDPKAVANAAAATEALGAPPVGVTLKLPDNVLFSEEPQMAYWCDERKQWRLDGFVDVKYDEESRMLSYKTVNFGPLACIQDKHINMPFQSWELRPIGVDHARFTIIAAILEAEIEIKGPLCCFKQTSDSEVQSELDAVRDKWMDPKQLIKVLKNTGVNLFPEEDSKKYVSISEKDQDVENGLYQQMALSACHFAYSWSKWNTESGTERIILQGCEKLEDDIPLDPQPTEDGEEEEWALLMVSKERAMKLKMTEYDEEFSDVHAEGSQFHADLYHMVIDLSTEPGLERMRNSHYEFVDAVYQMLAATRVIAYS